MVIPVRVEGSVVKGTGKVCSRWLAGVGGTKEYAYTIMNEG